MIDKCVDTRDLPPEERKRVLCQRISDAIDAGYMVTVATCPPEKAWAWEQIIVGIQGLVGNPVPPRRRAPAP